MKRKNKTTSITRKRITLYFTLTLPSPVEGEGRVRAFATPSIEGEGMKAITIPNKWGGGFTDYLQLECDVQFLCDRFVHQCHILGHTLIERWEILALDKRH